MEIMFHLSYYVPTTLTIILLRVFRESFMDRD